jgi:hypothetical protein
MPAIRHLPSAGMTTASSRRQPTGQQGDAARVSGALERFLELLEVTPRSDGRRRRSYTPARSPGVHRADADRAGLRPGSDPAAQAERRRGPVRRRRGAGRAGARRRTRQRDPAAPRPRDRRWPQMRPARRRAGTAPADRHARVRGRRRVRPLRGRRLTSGGLAPRRCGSSRSDRVGDKHHSVVTASRPRLRSPRALRR